MGVMLFTQLLRKEIPEYLIAEDAVNPSLGTWARHPCLPHFSNKAIRVFHVGFKGVI